ncbi:MAG: PTS sugar transporter subunit IIA, partial [Psychrilyobacter sp.]|uniref:PTS sugar transporter subunit IIA domain-containing protein n=1 Tax=Psychrilyobacter sp. TaxID=2586924 RepID=UPI003C735524
IISGHGNFAKGFEKTIELVIGKQKKLNFINFTEEKTPLDLEKEFKNAIKNIDLKEILFLTDIIGGTPFITAALMANESIKVISGCNLAMIIEAINLRDDQDLDSSIHEIMESAIEGIELFQPNIISDSIGEDGI